MEQMLWTLRARSGQQDGESSSSYILPLLFIKRLSAVFDDEVERLTQKFGDHEDGVEVIEEDPFARPFYRTPRGPLGVWCEPPRAVRLAPREKAPKTLGEQLTATIRAIVMKHNRDLAGSHRHR